MWTKRIQGSVVRLLLAVLVWTVGAAAAARADIYLNGASGDDTKDGLTSATAVKTFATAKAKLAAQGAGIIKVTGQVTISSNTTLSFSDTGDGVSIGWPEAMVQRDTGYSEFLFLVNGNTTLTLTNIVVDGNRENVIAQRALLDLPYTGSSLRIQDGAVLRNNANALANNAAGAVYLANGASFLMTGGAITNNAVLGSSSYGGGIGLSTFTGSFEMTGGCIADNRCASSYGGGIGSFNSTAILLLSGQATISGNVTTNGQGGGIGYSVGTLAVKMSGDAVVSNNMTRGNVQGGGIICSTLEMSDQARICSNFAGRDGGGAYCWSLTMRDSAGICDNVTSNATSSYGQGAGVAIGGNGSAVLSGNAFVRSNVVLTSNTDGGGIYLSAGATLTTSNAVSICGNTATGNGGGISMATGNGWLSLNGGSVSSNGASNGGGFCFRGTNGWITGTTIEGNTLPSTGLGGGCNVGAAAGRLYFDSVRLAGNSAGYWGDRGGGAIYVSPGSVVCSNCVFEGNSAVGYGGSVDFYSTTSNSVFSVCVFSNNVSKKGGGAVRGVNPLLFEDCVFDANACTNGDGGAVYADTSSQLTVRRCLFERNACSGSGGAFRFAGTSSLPQLVENCTLFGNVAAYGAAVYASGATTGDILLDFCTVRGNTNLNSSSAAIAQASGAPVTLSSTAVAYNYYGATVADVKGTLKAADHCYFTQASNTVTITSAANNLYLGTSGDPKLADTPADNGGTLLPDGTRMPTLAFAKTSPLRNRGGTAAGIDTDARGAGYPRVQESSADIGAFEFKPATGFRVVIVDNALDIPYDWFTNACPDLANEDTTEAVATNALCASGANGLARWESYALGLDSRDPSSVVLCDARQTADPDKVIFFARNVNPATNGNLSVNYVLEGSRDGNTWSVAGAGTTNAPELALPSLYSLFRMRTEIVLK